MRLNSHETNLHEALSLTAVFGQRVNFFRKKYRTIFYTGSPIIAMDYARMKLNRSVKYARLQRQPFANLRDWIAFRSVEIRL